MPQFKLWLGTNDLPAITGTGDAIWRKLHVVDFPVTFLAAEQDHNLNEKLRAELPSILNC